MENQQNSPVHLKMAEIVEKQSNLLASKDLSAFTVIQAATPPVPDTVEDKSDDEIAFEEALARGMTEDERIYFDNAGFHVPGF